MNRNIWIKKIRYIENLKDEDLIRMESFSIVASFILSKEEFKLNYDLKPFMNELGIDCKPYLLKSRTAMLARAMRIVEKADVAEILNYINIIKLRIQVPDSSNKAQTNNKKPKENYMKKMLELYGRKDKQ